MRAKGEESQKMHLTTLSLLIRMKFTCISDCFANHSDGCYPIRDFPRFLDSKYLRFKCRNCIRRKMSKVVHTLGTMIKHQNSAILPKVIFLIRAGVCKLHILYHYIILYSYPLNSLRYNQSPF